MALIAVLVAGAAAGIHGASAETAAVSRGGRPTRQDFKQRHTQNERGQAWPRSDFLAANGLGATTASAGESMNAKYGSTCMYVLGALLVSCCCISPASQHFSQRESSTMKAIGWALSITSILIATGALIYVTLWSSIFKDYWAGGFTQVGAWCGVLCLWAILACCCGALQLCYLGAFSLGMVGALGVSGSEDK